MQIRNTVSVPPVQLLVLVPLVIPLQVPVPVLCYFLICLEWPLVMGPAVISLYLPAL
jgi:hypothetical protein